MSTPNWDDLSPAPPAGEIMSWDSLSPTPPGPRSLLKEVPIQAYAGATIDLPRQFGQALQWMSDPGLPTYQTGREIQDWAERREKDEPDLAPQVEGRGVFGRALSTGARALAPSTAIMLPAAVGAVAAPVVGAGALIGSAVGAATGAFGLFGASQAQETYDKLQKAGVPEDEARKAGWINLMIEGGGETAGTIAGLKLFGMASKAITKGMSPVAGAIAGATDTAVLKPFLKQLPKTLATEMGTEFGQGYGEAWVERRYGATQEHGQTPWAQGVQGAEAALGMTILLAPFGLSGFAARAKQNERRAQALEDPTTPMLERLAASTVIFNEINAVDKDAAKAWSQNSTLAIVTGSPIILDETTAQPGEFAGKTPNEIQGELARRRAPSIAEAAAREVAETEAAAKAISEAETPDAAMQAALTASRRPIGPTQGGLIDSQAFTSEQASELIGGARDVQAAEAERIANEENAIIERNQTNRPWAAPESEPAKPSMATAFESAFAKRDAEIARFEGLINSQSQEPAAPDAGVVIPETPAEAQALTNEHLDAAYNLTRSQVTRDLINAERVRRGAKAEIVMPPEVVAMKAKVDDLGARLDAARPTSPEWNDLSSQWKVAYNAWQDAASAVRRGTSSMVTSGNGNLKNVQLRSASQAGAEELPNLPRRGDAGIQGENGSNSAAAQEDELSLARSRLSQTGQAGTPAVQVRGSEQPNAPSGLRPPNVGDVVVPEVSPRITRGPAAGQPEAANSSGSSPVQSAEAPAPLIGKAAAAPVEINNVKTEKMTLKALKHFAERGKTKAIKAAAEAELDRRDEAKKAKPLAPKQIVQRARLAKRARNRKIIDQNKDTLLEAIAKKGGINIAERDQIMADRSGNHQVPFVGFVFSRNGMGLDDMASSLNADFYLSQEDMEDGAGGVHVLMVKVREDMDLAIAGKPQKHYSATREEMSTEEEMRARQEAEEDAALEAAVAKQGLPDQPEVIEKLADMVDVLAQISPERLAALQEQYDAVSDAEFEAILRKEASNADQRPIQENTPSGEAVGGEAAGGQEEGDANRVEQARRVYNPNQQGFDLGPTEEKPAEPQAPETPKGDTDATLARSKPRQMIIFAKPYVGKTGAKLTGYEWKWRAEEIVDKRGEDRTIRISDWEESITNPETNRDIVHQFQIERTDGDVVIVSAESAAKLLGVSQSTARASAKRLLEQEIEAQQARGRLERYLEGLDKREWFATPAAAIEALPGALRRIWLKYRLWGDHIGRDDSYNYTQTRVDFTVGPKGYLALESATDVPRGWKGIQLTPPEIWDKNGRPKIVERPSLALAGETPAELKAHGEAEAAAAREKAAAEKAAKEAEDKKRLEAEAKARNEIGAANFELTAPAAGDKKAMKAASDKAAIDQLAGQGGLFQQSPVYQAVTALQGAVNDLAKAIAPGAENAAQEPLSVEQRKGRDQGQAPGQRDLFTETEVSREENPQPTIVVEPAQRGTLHIGFDKIDTPEKAAHAFAALRKAPREYFQILLTDKADKPLAVYSLFAGTVTQTSVYPREVLTAAYATPGAAKVWFAHNHPSGVPEPSRADEYLTKHIGEGLGRDLGIEFQGHIIIAGNKAVFFDNDRKSKVVVPPASRKYAVPIMERTIKRQSFAARESLGSPAAARDYIRNSKLDEPGLILMDAQNRALTFWPMKTTDMAKLRTSEGGKGFGGLARMVSKLNPASAMIFDPRSNVADLARAAGNIKTALALMDVRLMDAFVRGDQAGAQSGKLGEAGPLVSLEESGMIVAAPTFFSQKNKPWYYSALARGIETATMKAAPAAGWKSYIQGLVNKGTVKQAEIEATGINDWLATQEGKVTKEQVQAFMEQGGVRVTETVLGEKAKPVWQDWARAMRERGLNANEADSIARRAAAGDENAIDEAYQSGVTDDDVRGSIARADETKFEQYQLPGSVPGSYRELVLTLPESAAQADYNRLVDEGMPLMTAKSIVEEKYPKFESTHFPDAGNYLAHTRVNDRILPDGRKVLFVEEIQSDRAQKGRQEGFAVPVDPAAKSALEKQLREELDENGRTQRARQIEADIRTIEKSYSGIAPAPFVTKTDSWTALVLKRLLRYAAEGDYAAISWTRGDQQVERYTSALRKAVDVIEWKKTPEGVQIVGYKDDGYANANDPTGSRRTKVVDTTEKESALSDAIGKSMADKIRNDPNQTGTIEGDNITVSDTGMAGYYDRIVPKVAAEVAKKVGGGKVVELPIPISGETRYKVERDSQGVWVAFNPADQYDFHEFQTEKQARDFATGPGLSKQQALEITPAMREKIMGGLPLFRSQTAGQSGQTVAQVEEQIAPARAKLKIRIIVHTTNEEGAKATGVDIPSTARAMYHAGQIHLFSGSLNSALETENATWHEVLHAGLSHLYGTGSREYETALTKIASLNRNIRMNAANWRGKYGKEAVERAKEYGMTEVEAKRYMVLQSYDEALADLSGANAKISGLKPFLAAVQKFLRSIGLTNLADAMEGKTDAEALALVTKARNAVMTDGAHIGMGETAPAYSVPPKELHTTEGEPFGFNKLTNRRFMFNPETREMVFGKAGEGTYGSHAQDLKAAGVRSPFDDFVRGWVSGPSKGYPAGIIHFAPPIEVQNAEQFNRGAETMKEFAANGATPDTTVRGFGGRGQQGKWEQTLREAAPSMFEGDQLNAEFSRKDQTETPEFKAWFKDSKVVDAEGKPLVVYHGTNASFDVANPHSPTAVYRLDGKEITEANSWDMGEDRKGMPEGYHYGALSDAVTLGAREALQYRTEEARRGGHIGKPDTDRTLRDLRRLQKGEVTRATESRPSGAGMWFTPDHTYSFISRDRVPEDAGGNVMPVYLSIKNPVYLNAAEIEGAGYSFKVEQYKKQGYDGAVFASDPKDMRKTGWSGATQIVAFDPTQIKSAIGNTGAFSQTNPDIRFSQPAQRVFNSVMQSPKTSAFLKGITSSPASLGVFNAFNSQYHKAEMLSRKGIHGFKAVFNEMQAFLNDINALAVKAEQQAPAIFRELTGMNPKSAWAYFKGAAKESDIAAIGPWLNHGTLYGKGNPLEGRVWTDDQLRGKFEGIGTKNPGLAPLTEQQIDLYHQARAAIDRSLEDNAKALMFRHVNRYGVVFDKDMSLADVAEIVREQLDAKIEAEKERAGALQDLIDDAETEFGDEDQRDAHARLKRDIEKAEKLAADMEAVRETVTGIEDKANGLIEHGYMPLMRFGNRTVTARDVEGKVQFFYTTDGKPLVPGSANLEMNEVAEAVRALHPDWQVTTGVKAERAWQMYQGMSMEALENFLDFLDPETKAAIERDATIQEYLTSAVNNRSVLKRMIHREGTPGFAKDVPRILSAFITSNARNASGLYHLAEAGRLVEAIPDRYGDVKDEASDLVKYVTEPGEEAAKLRGFLFFHFLGGSLAAAAVNMTQTVMMTAPWLSQHTSAGGLAKSLIAAAKLAVQDPANIEGEKGKMLQKAERTGITAPQQIFHLTATAANNPFSSNRGFRSFMTIWGSLFSTVEVWNRRVAFMAAYDAGKENGLAGDALYDFATRAVVETQLIYNKGNKPNLGRGAVGSTVMTFKAFSIGYLELVRRLPPKQQLLMLGIMALAAGAEGLPFAEDIEDLIDTLGQWLGFSTNTGKWTGKVIKDTLGPEYARPILKGLGGMLPIDLHSRLGMQNLLPGTAFFKPSEIDKTRDVAEAVGPFGSVLKSMSDALQLLARGKWDSAAVGVAPKAARDAYNGFHMLTTGESQDTKGRLAMKDVTAGEAVGKLIGFNPRRAAAQSEAKREIMLDKNLRTVRMDEITSDIADAMLKQDLVARQEALDRLRRWNINNPEMRIDQRQVMRSVQERIRAARRTSEERFIKSVPKPMKQDAREALK